MTFPEYLEIVEYWNTMPPFHRLAASFMGWKPPEKGNLEDFAALMGVELPNE